MPNEWMQYVTDTHCKTAQLRRCWPACPNPAKVTTEPCEVRRWQAMRLVVMARTGEPILRGAAMCVGAWHIADHFDQRDPLQSVKP